MCEPSDSHRQYQIHNVNYNKANNTVEFLTPGRSVLTGDDVVDQDGRRGDLVWSNTSRCYIVLWKDGGTCEVVTE
jgi:hypothetical protein